MWVQVIIHVLDLMLVYLISVGKNGPWISSRADQLKTE